MVNVLCPPWNRCSGFSLNLHGPGSHSCPQLREGSRGPVMCVWRCVVSVSGVWLRGGGSVCACAHTCTFVSASNKSSDQHIPECPPAALHLSAEIGVEAG